MSAMKQMCERVSVAMGRDGEIDEQVMAAANTRFAVVNELYGNDSAPITLGELVTAVADLWPDVVLTVAHHRQTVYDQDGETVAEVVKPESTNAR